MANLVITIDGPAGSGKSTAAKLLARKLDASFLDTGAMYRAVTLAAMQSGIDMSDQEKLLEVMGKKKIDFTSREGTMLVRIDGADVSEQIRKPEVTANAHYVASAAKLRERLVEMQREFAAGEEKIVTEGRDQGTVAFGDADIKFYLTANTGERAKRRLMELRAKGRSDRLEDVQRAIEERDKSDKNRAVGPLRPADDAIFIDTTKLSIEEVVEKVLGCVKEKRPRQV